MNSDKGALRKGRPFIAGVSQVWGNLELGFFYHLEGEGGMSVGRARQYGVCHNEMEPDGERRHIRSEPRGERLTAEPHILLHRETDRHVPPSVP